MLENQPNLTLFQQEVADLVVETRARVTGVVTQTGIEFRARAVVLTVGTFLGGQDSRRSHQLSGRSRGRSAVEPSC